MNDETKALLNNYDPAVKRIAEFLSNPPKNNLKKTTIVTFLGYIFGVTGSLVAFPLGKKFGDTLMDNKEGSGLGYFFAITALISLASLGGVTASKQFKKSINSKGCSSVAVESSKLKRCNSYLKSSTSTVLALVSAIQFAYVTGKYMGGGNAGSIILAIIGFSMYTLFNKMAVDTVFNDVFSSILICIDSKYRNALNTFNKNIKMVELFYVKARDDLILERYSTIFEESQRNGEKLSQLFDLSGTTDTSINVSEQKRVSCKKIVVIIASIVGFTLGAMVGVVYYIITLEAMIWFFYFIKANVDTNAAHSFIDFVAIVASVANAALGAVYLKERFEQVATKITDPSYQIVPYFTNKHIRTAVAFLGVICGAVAAIPVTYLLYDYALINEESRNSGLFILIIATFLAPTAIRSRSFEQMLNDFIDFVRSFRSPTVEDKRERIFKSIRSIAQCARNSSRGEFYKLNQVFFEEKKQNRDSEDPYSMTP